MAGPKRVTEKQLTASPRQPLRRSTSTSPASSTPTTKTAEGHFAEQTHFPGPLAAIAPAPHAPHRPHRPRATRRQGLRRGELRNKPILQSCLVQLPNRCHFHSRTRKGPKPGLPYYCRRMKGSPPPERTPTRERRRHGQFHQRDAESSLSLCARHVT